LSIVFLPAAKYTVIDFDVFFFGRRTLFASSEALSRLPIEVDIGFTNEELGFASKKQI